MVCDYATWLQKFESSSGFKKERVTIGDVEKLKHIKAHRMTIGNDNRVRSKGGMHRETFLAVSGLDVNRIMESVESVKAEEIEKKKNPRKRRDQSQMGEIANPNEQHELFHYLSESIYDYQTMVLVGEFQNGEKLLLSKPTIFFARSAVGRTQSLTGWFSNTTNCQSTDRAGTSTRRNQALHTRCNHWATKKCFIFSSRTSSKE